MIPTQNTGVLLGRRPEDFAAGTLPYEVRNQSGVWAAPIGEKQHSNNADSMACVSYSAINSIEMQIKHLTGQELNFSDRFIAKISGTTPQGNWLYKVADTIRKYGLVKQEDWPEPENYNWNSYYSEIPQSVIDKGQEFLREWDVAYEWIEPEKDDLQKHLKHAPIQIVITRTNPNHAVVLNGIDSNFNYFDTYNPFTREINTPPHSALKIVITPKNMTNSIIVKRGQEYGIYDPATSPDGLITLMRNRGMTIPLKPDGSLDFDKLPVQGNVI